MHIRNDSDGVGKCSVGELLDAPPMIEMNSSTFKAPMLRHSTTAVAAAAHDDAHSRKALIACAKQIELEQLTSQT